MSKNQTSEQPKMFNQLGDADLMSAFRALTAEVAKRGLLGGAKAKEVGVEAIEMLRVLVAGKGEWQLASPSTEALKIQFEAVKLALIANGEISGIGV